MASDGIFPLTAIQYLYLLPLKTDFLQTRWHPVCNKSGFNTLNWTC